MREDVEHGDRVAQRVVPLLAGLAVDGGREHGGRFGQCDQLSCECVAELLQGEPRQNAADGRGVRRPVAGEPEILFADPPMIRGPPLEAGEVGLAAGQAEEG
jgi:hypothetical protein